MNSLVAASQLAAAKEDAAHRACRGGRQHRARQPRPRPRFAFGEPPRAPSTPPPRGRPDRGAVSGGSPSAAADRASFAELRAWEVAEARAELARVEARGAARATARARGWRRRKPRPRAIGGVAEARLAAAKAEAHDARRGGAPVPCAARDERLRGEAPRGDGRAQLAEDSMRRGSGHTRRSARAETRARLESHAPPARGREKASRGAASPRRLALGGARHGAPRARRRRSEGPTRRAFAKGSDARSGPRAGGGGGGGPPARGLPRALYKRLEVQDGRLHGVREDARELTQAQVAALARVENALAGRVDASEAREAGAGARGAEARASGSSGARRCWRRPRRTRCAPPPTARRRRRRSGTLGSPRSPNATTRGRRLGARSRRLGEELLQAKLDAARRPSARRVAAATGRAILRVGRRGPRGAGPSPRLRRRVMREKQAPTPGAKISRGNSEPRSAVDAREEPRPGGSGSAEGGPSGAILGALRTPPPAPRRRAHAPRRWRGRRGGGSGAARPGAASAETQRMDFSRSEASGR